MLFQSVLLFLLSTLLARFTQAASVHSARADAYKITLRVYQTNTNAYFHPVEQTVWNYASGGTWSQADGEYSLTMGGSGTSGTIRFQADTGENFLTAVGVDNSKRWCDIVPDLTADQTGVTINGEYYNNGTRAAQRDKQLSTFSIKNSKGRNFEITYTQADGTDLRANIVVS